MINIIKEQWDKNKELLRKQLETGMTFNDCGYNDLVKLCFDTVYNNNLGHDLRPVDTGSITCIDDGDCRGTLLFIMPFCIDDDRPSEYDYLMTYVGYGSCPGCDTLEEIQENGRAFVLTDEQVTDFMALCKDILSNTIRPYNTGWRQTDLFDVCAWNENEDAQDNVGDDDK